MLYLALFCPLSKTNWLLVLTEALPVTILLSEQYLFAVLCVPMSDLMFSTPIIASSAPELVRK